MIPKRVISSSFASRSLSYLLQSQCRISVAGCNGRSLLHRQSLAWRFLSTTGGGSGGDDSNKDGESRNKADDPFGVSFDDGDDLGKVGPPSQFPPKYKRDAATGKLTGDVETELTDEEREILRMDPLQRDKTLLKRLISSWKETEGEVDETTGDPKALAEFARRVRLAKMSLNVLGRTVKAQGAKSILDDGEEFGRDKETGFTQPLTKSEFKTFQKFMREKHHTEVTDEDVPVHDDADDDDTSFGSSRSRNRPHPLSDDEIQMQGVTDDAAVDPDNPDLSLKWMTARAAWQVNQKAFAETPFDDMLPRDLNLSRIVNRKRAKILPRELLHHNNMALLRRYITPTGQIMHRSRTRLGARDQRKIGKLIRRARCLGLIPHSGQFVVEDHGNIYEEDIHKDLPWEEELERRGLVIKHQEKDSRKEDEV